jgi:hypothetical protein
MCRVLMAALLLSPWSVALAQISFVGTSAPAPAASAVGSVSAPPPGGLAAGDVLLASVAVRDGVAVASAPTGWTLVTSAGAGQSVGTYVYRKVATAAEPVSYTWTLASARRAAVAVVALRGVDGSDPVAASSARYSSASSTSLVASSITPGIPNAMLVAFWGVANGNGALSSPAGMVERFDSGTGAGPNGVVLGGATETLASGGATGTRTATSTAAASYTAILVALRPGTAVSLSGFSVAAATTASTCLAHPVTIRALDSFGNTLSNYTGTVNLSTSTGRGGWSASASSGPVTENGDANDGIASYTFRAADNGQVTLLLANQSADTLTVTATDSVGAALGLSGVVAFRDNAFVITATDPLATVPVAGRPHAMQAALWRRDTTQSPANCAIATNYAGVRNLKAWYTADLSHPAGATPPAAGAVSLPPAVPGANNLALTFVSGVATFTLNTADVGKYAVNLRDDSRSFASGADIDGSSAVLTVRPFALAITNVRQGATANPGGTATTGSRFVAAGDAFAATVGGYLWNAAADADNDGVPDGAHSNVIAGGLAPRFSWPTTLSAGSTGGAQFSPTGGSLGTLTRAGGGSLTLSGFSGGAATVTDLRYSEVGSIGLAASASSYLDTAGVDLSGTAVNGAGEAVPVGRFHPASFALVPGAAPVVPFCGSGAAGFTYMGQPALGLAFSIEARNAQGVVTVNYRSGAYNVGAVSYVAEDADNGVDVSGRLGGIPAATWSAGVYTVNTSNAVFARPSAAPIPDGPFESLLIGAMVTDPDGVQLAGRDMNPAAVGCGSGCNARSITAVPTRVRFGRLRIGNALGSPLLPLPVPLTLEHWNGTGFVVNAQDNCTRLTNTAVGFSGPSGGVVLCNTSGAPSGTDAIVFSAGRSTNFRLTPPGNIAGGSVDLTLNLAAAATGSTCSAGSAAAATAAARPWLQGNWGAATYDRNPRARASFGRYTKAPDIIYLRETY